MFQLPFCGLHFTFRCCIDPLRSRPHLRKCVASQVELLPRPPSYVATAEVPPPPLSTKTCQKGGALQRCARKCPWTAPTPGNEPRHRSVPGVSLDFWKKRTCVDGCPWISRVKSISCGCARPPSGGCPWISDHPETLALILNHLIFPPHPALQPSVPRAPHPN